MKCPICAGCFVSLSCGVWMSAPLSNFPHFSIVLSHLAGAPPLTSDALLVGEATSPLRPFPPTVSCRRGDLAALPLPVSVRLPALTNRLLTRRLPLLEMEVVEAEPEAEGALRRRFAIVGLFSFHFFFRCCRSHRCGCGFGWIFAILMFCLFLYFVEAEFEV